MSPAEPPVPPAVDVDFAAFLARREVVAAALDELAALAATAGAAERARQLREARGALLRDAFRLLVLGEFKRGKSTLLNALLGDAVLPARVAPATGLITELRYADAPEATLYPADGSAPRPIPVDQLRAAILLPDEDDPAYEDAAAAGARPPGVWTHVSVGWPLPLLRNNVELVDSPGLNEHAVRDTLVLDYLPRADALVLVLSCEQQLSASERQFLDGYVGREGVRNTFFVWNRYDAVADDPAEVAALRALSAAELAPRCPAERGVSGEDRVFYTSARDGLRGRRAGDAAGWEASGVPALERALERFLAGERGRVKLSTPLRAGAVAADALLTRELPARERLAAEPVEALRARYVALRPRLDALTAERAAVLRAVERRRALLATEVATAWTAESTALADALPGLAEGVELSAWTAIRSSREARRTVVRALEEKLDLRRRRWRATTLEPLVDRHLAALTADLDQRLRGFEAELASIRAALDPGGPPRVADGEDIPPLSRVLGAVGGLFLGGVGAAMEGATGGVSGMLRGLGYHVALGVGLVLAGAGAPVILAASAALGAVRVAMTGASAADRVRAEVAADMAKAVRAGVPDATAAVQEKVEAAFAPFVTALDAGLRLLVDEVDAQVRAVLAERAEGEAALAAERARTEAPAGEIRAVAARLRAADPEADG